MSRIHFGLDLIDEYRKDVQVEDLDRNDWQLATALGMGYQRALSGCGVSPSELESGLECNRSQIVVAPPSAAACSAESWSGVECAHPRFVPSASGCLFLSEATGCAVHMHQTPIFPHDCTRKPFSQAPRSVGPTQLARVVLSDPDTRNDFHRA